MGKTGKIVATCIAGAFGIAAVIAFITAHNYLGIGMLVGKIVFGIFAITE